MQGRTPLAVRVALLGAALAYAVFVGVLGATPIAWEAAGRPDETYPELFYVGYGWPSALALLGASGLLWTKLRTTLALGLVWVGALMIIWLCTLVAAFGLFTLAQLPWARTGVLNAVFGFSTRHFHFLLTAAVIGIVSGLILSLRTPGNSNAAPQVH